MKTKKTIYLYMFDTLADYEIGFVTAGINNPMMQKDPEKYQLKTFNVKGDRVRTMGGLKIIPDLSIDEVKLSDAEMIILPGGISWGTDGNQEAANLAKDLHNNGVKVAAICGATLGIAKTGILDSVKHTGNSRDYLKTSGYKGSEFYTDSLSENDKGIITASGTASLEFARDIFKALDLYKDEVLEAWYKLFKTGSPEAYQEMMKAAGMN